MPLDIGENEIFTNEIDFDESKVTILDDEGFYDDVQIYLYDDIVIIRQWDEEIENFKDIGMSPEMFEELQKALNSPVGAFVMR